MAEPVLVLLAAGEGRRLGEPKALVRLREEPPATPVELLLAAGALPGSTPLVVTGAHADQVEAALPSGVEFARNEAWRAGRTGSVARAVRARPARDLLLAPVDVPLVPAEVFAALREAWERAGSPPRGWLGPCVEEDEPAERHRFGHPVVLGRVLAAEALELPPDRPLTELRARAEPLLAVLVRSRAILDDLDTPEDLAALRRRPG